MILVFFYRAQLAIVKVRVRSLGAKNIIFIAKIRPTYGFISSQPWQILKLSFPFENLCTSCAAWNPLFKHALTFCYVCRRIRCEIPGRKFRLFVRVRPEVALDGEQAECECTPAEPSYAETVAGLCEAARTPMAVKKDLEPFVASIGSLFSFFGEPHFAILG